MHHMNRHLAAVLAGTILLGAAAPAALADGHPGRFQDLGNVTWAQGAIGLLSSEGVIQGYSSTQFAPNQPVTREQMAALILRFLGRNIQTGPLSFSDQGNVASWAQSSVYTAVQDNLMVGEGSYFHPNQDVTRAQAVTVVVRALGQAQAAQALTNPSLPFADASAIPTWAQGYVAWAVQNNLIQGSGGNFGPNAAITRAEAAVMLSRAQAMLPSQPLSQTVAGLFVSSTYQLAQIEPLTPAVPVGVYGSNSSSGSVSLSAASSPTTVTGSTYGNTQGVGAITIQTTSGPQTLGIDPSIQVYINEKLANMTDLTPGDPVLVHVNQAGLVNFVMERTRSIPQWARSQQQSQQFGKNQQGKGRHHGDN